MKTILIADDHDLVRDTLAAYLQGTGDFKTLTAPDFEAAMHVMGGIEPVDMMILDYHMPGMNGLVGLEKARQRFPHIKLALISGIATKEVATGAMAAGADGYLPKSLNAGSLVNAIKFVLSGERYFPFDLSQAASASQPPGAFATLSPREMETLQHLCAGLSNKEIARKLDIAEVTVKLHVKNLLAKLGATNRTQAAMMAREQHVF